MIFILEEERSTWTAWSLFSKAMRQKGTISERTRPTPRLALSLRSRTGILDAELNSGRDDHLLASLGPWMRTSFLFSFPLPLLVGTYARKVMLKGRRKDTQRAYHGLIRSKLDYSVFDLTATGGEACTGGIESIATSAPLTKVANHACDVHSATVSSMRALVLSHDLQKKHRNQFQTYMQSKRSVKSSVLPSLMEPSIPKPYWRDVVYSEAHTQSENGKKV